MPMTTLADRSADELLNKRPGRSSQAHGHGHHFFEIRIIEFDHELHTNHGVRLGKFNGAL